MPRKLRRNFGLPRETKQLEDAVAEVLDPIASVPLLDGRLIEGVSIAAGAAVPLAHGLGRRYRGFLVVLRTTSGRAPYVPRSDDAERHLWLTCADAFAGSLWVF